MNYDSSTDKFTYTSDFNVAGTYTYLIRAEDEDDNSDTAEGTFVIEEIEQVAEDNWKPILAIVFAIILLLIGLLASFKRPLNFKGSPNKLLTFLSGVLPFVIVEALTGVASMFVEALRVPPIMGAGMIIDLVILAIGIIVILAIFMKGQPPEVTPEGEPAPMPMGPPPEPVEDAAPPPPETETPPPLKEY